MNLKLLRTKRIQQRLTQEKLAEMAGMTRSNYTRKETGKISFNLGDIRGLRKALKLTNKEVVEIFF